MEQFVNRVIKLSFDQATERTDVTVTANKIIYATGGTPLYIVDTDGVLYNWLHIATITPAEVTPA